MRILTLITVLVCLSILASAACGEAPPRTGGDPTVPTETTTVTLPNATHLTLSPLFIEILAIEERARETELFLLKELAETSDAAEAARIVRSLEWLDVDRRLEILETRMEWARRSGQFDLALRLRNEIVELMTGEMQAMN